MHVHHIFVLVLCCHLIHSSDPGLPRKPSGAGLAQHPSLNLPRENATVGVKEFSGFAAGFSGFAAGFLHAVTGPDHLAALLPLCMGKPWYMSSRVGGYWGLGHGIGASLMGAIAFAVKGSFNVLALSDFLEAGVGVTLILIGLYGLKETHSYYHTRAKKDDDIEMSHTNCSHSHSHASPGHGHSHEKHLQHTYSVGPVAVVATGIFHGFSGTGHLLGVIPALTLPSWQSAGSYLSMFCIGTTVAMSCFTGTVGHASIVMRKHLDIPDLPVRLSLISSCVAIAVGLIWLMSTVMS